jgi:hypothetical protein
MVVPDALPGRAAGHAPGRGPGRGCGRLTSLMPHGGPLVRGWCERSPVRIAAVQGGMRHEICRPRGDVTPSVAAVPPVSVSSSRLPGSCRSLRTGGWDRSECYEISLSISGFVVRPTCLAVAVRVSSVGAGARVRIGLVDPPREPCGDEGDDVHVGVDGAVVADHVEVVALVGECRSEWGCRPEVLGVQSGAW